MSVDFTKIPNPCYVVVEDKLRSNVQKISKVASESGVEFILAFKASALWKCFDVIKPYIKTATASSICEAKLCNDVFGQKAHTYCVAIDDSEIDQLLELSSHITFNSLSQFERFKNKAIEKGVSIGIRVNPEYSEAHTELYNPSSPVSRLGMTKEHFMNGLPKEIEGLHFHVLCENNSFALENTLEAFEKHFGQFLPQIKWVNFGGGHLITHKDYKTEHLLEVLKRFKAKYPHLHVIMEPGAAYFWQSGYLTAKVIDIVENNNLKTAILNVSFTAHMPDTLEMPYKPNILNAIPEHVEGKFVYRMGGTSCLAGDFISEYSFDEPLQIGSLIIFDDMIHYTTVKTTMFNGVNHPSLGMWTTDDEFKLFRKFEYEDYKNRMS